MANFLDIHSRKPYGILTLAPGASEEVGLWGGGPNGEDLVIQPNDLSIATTSRKTLVYSRDPHVRIFTLHALRIGHVMIEARLGDGGPVWAYMQLAVANIPPGEILQRVGQDAYKHDRNYLDNVSNGHFDIVDNSFWVDHQTGITIDLNYQKILENLKNSQGSTMYVYYQDRRNNIIYPRIIDRLTAPNITDLVRQTEEVLPGARTMSALGLEIVSNPWLNMSWVRVRPRVPASSIQRSRTKNVQQVNLPRGPKSSLVVAADRRSLVKILIDELKAAGKPVKVNLGGTGEQPDCINLNPLLDEQIMDVPMVIVEKAEAIGSIFPAGSVDRVISNNIVYGTVSWTEAAIGSFKALKSGGTISISPFAGQLVEHMTDIGKALRSAGFTILKLTDHFVEGVKP